MDLEWDEQKNRLNIAKHRIDFNDAYKIFEQPVFIRRDSRFDYGEERWIALGEMEETVVLMVYAIRGDRLRLISLRKANKRERNVYEKEIKKT